MEYQKIKSVAKQIVPKGDALSSIILGTTKIISDTVGSTLGPGGTPVLIERYEHNMPPTVTKDGVTVFRALGFSNPVAQVVMESMRDSAVRTASEAGDGTTTATILGEAIIRRTHEFCKKHPRISPQRVVRKLDAAFREVVEPALIGRLVEVEPKRFERVGGVAIKADASTEDGRKILRAVAKISANGDGELADAVMQCFEKVGDEGNVTIVEQSGPSSYEVEEIGGYPIPMGFEESCAYLYPKFINDSGRQMSVLNKPVFVLYHGVLNDIQTAYLALSHVGNEYARLLAGEQDTYLHSNVVFVASGFSEQVLGHFAAGWSIPNAIKIFPLVVPKSPMPNYQAQFLGDMAAVTGAKIFDPIDFPLDTAKLEDFGPGVDSFESGRFRSTILGRASDHGDPWKDAELEQANAIAQQLAHPESDLDRMLLQERFARLTGGIAKLRVVGASNGELKERRDRAEDAVCAVRGAMKYGCLPGGGWGLMYVINKLDKSDPVIQEILVPALMEPVKRLLENCGLDKFECMEVLTPVFRGLRENQVVVYDALEGKHGDPIELGVLDSTPAVVEAIRNSLSIATRLGTTGGIVAFPRDAELERREAVDVNEWIRNANLNEADQRP